MRRRQIPSQNGFTLVEISIVLVIIGLLIGGIMAGVNLIRTAQIRAVMTESQTYRAAILSFNEKFRAIPGDMINATDYWGIAGGTGSDSVCFGTDSSTLSDTKRTCNGDSNRVASTAKGAISSNLWYYGETFRFWQHLANAEMISGRYTGKTDSTTSNFTLTPGKNTPISKIDNATFVPSGYAAITSGNADWFDGMPVGTYIEFRSSGTLPPLSPAEAESIDIKMDDGIPASGTLWAPKSNSPNWPGCTTTATSAAQYNVTSPDKKCILSFFVTP